MRFCLYAFFFICGIYNAQNRQVFGTISIKNSTTKYSGNLILKPKNSQLPLLFASVDKKGNYTVQLEPQQEYRLEIPFLGKESSVYIINSTQSGQYDISLPEERISSLKEVNIKYQMPITIKEDTLIYKVSAFTNGSERKLEDVVKKLPGFEVTKEGAVSVNGKPITATLVEGSAFFNGNTKLALKSLPANALSEIEVIDNYSENKVRKNTTSENATVLNIKLKKEKKELYFGDAFVSGGLGKHFQTHLNLYKYSTKYNFTSIADANNIGGESLSISDILNLNGGAMEIINNPRFFEDLDRNLLLLALSNKLFYKNANQFMTTNFQKNTLKSKLDASVTFLNNQTQNFETRHSISLNKDYDENRELQGKLKNQMIQSQLKYTFSPNPYTIFTNVLSLKYSLLSQNNINNAVINQSPFFQTKLSDLQSYQIKQNLVMDKEISRQLNLSSYLKINLTKEGNTQDYFSTNPFLQPYLQPNTALNYPLLYLQKQTKQDILLGTNIGVKLNDLSKLVLEPLVIFKNNSVNNDYQPIINTAIFLNSMRFRQTITSLNLLYISKLGQNTTLRLGTDLRSHFTSIGSNHTFNFSNFNLLPYFEARYEWNSSHYLKLDYKTKTSFLNDLDYAPQLLIQDFNQIYQWQNSLSKVQKLNHVFNLHYFRNNGYYKYGYAAKIAYDYQAEGFVQAANLSAATILQSYSYVFSKNTARRWTISTDFNKEFFRLNFYTKLNFNYNTGLRIINNTSNTAIQKDYSLKWGVASKFKKTPVDFDFSYNKTWSMVSFQGENTFSNEELVLGLNASILKNFRLTIDATNTKTQNFNKAFTRVSNANIALSYSKEGSKFGYEICANNLFNNPMMFENTLIDNFTVQTSRMLLPRILLLKFSFSF